jgi:hypothetical protein
MMRSNFKMEYQNITMTKGDTLSFNFSVTDQNGDLIVLDSAYFTCKKIATEDTTIFKKALGSGISLLDDCYVVRVAPEDTKNVLAGLYFYDLQIGVGEDIFTILKGVFDIEQDVTF